MKQTYNREQAKELLEQLLTTNAGYRAGKTFSLFQLQLNLIAFLADKEAKKITIEIKAVLVPI